MSAATATAASATPILNATATAHAATCPSTAEETEAIYAEYSVEPPESDYAEIARVLANGKDERLDLHSEMSMAVSLAKKYGGIGTVCRALGVSEAAAKTVGFVGLSRISISNTRYEPSEDGPLAVVIPVADSPWGDDTEVYDLLAFLKDVPQRCWSRLGNARCLGRWNLENAVPWITTPNDDQEPVIAFRSPLEWLRDGCEGFCLLDEDWLLVETTGVPSIQPANGDLAFGRKLKQLAIRQARLPKIVIPRTAT